MNVCFFIGEIRKIEYQFMINKVHTAIIIMKVQIKDGNQIIAIGYNEIADWCYQRIDKGKEVMIKGRLNSKMECEINGIEYFW